MTADEALEHKRKGGKLYEPMEFNRHLKYEGPIRVTWIPAVAQGGPGDDSNRIVIPAHHFRVSK